MGLVMLAICVAIIVVGAVTLPPIIYVPAVVLGISAAFWVQRREW